MEKHISFNTIILALDRIEAKVQDINRTLGSQLNAVTLGLRRTRGLAHNLKRRSLKQSLARMQKTRRSR